VSHLGLLAAESDRVMTKRARNLIGAIADPSNLALAYRLTARGKRLSSGYLEFKEYDALNLALLADELKHGSYRPGAPSIFTVYDPKRRTIAALPFRDRVAEQAICRVIGPTFDRAMLPRAFACRKGKGTHAGVRMLQAELRRLERDGSQEAASPAGATGKPASVWFLKTDFASYFASIERTTLWRLIDAKISCRATRLLLERLIPRDGIGLPIGSLTSQIFANYYAGATLDRHLQQALGEPHWYRYMDDLVVLGRSPTHLRALKEEIEHFSRERLGLRFSKWLIAPSTRGVNFLGYRIFADHKLLRRDSVTRARRKIAAWRRAGDVDRLERFLPAWLGHARFADANNLLRSLALEDG
jgi:hypothetical protein